MLNYCLRLIVLLKFAVRFLRRSHLIEHALDGVDDEQVIIVPDFLAEGYFTRQVVPAKLGDKLRIR